MAEQNVYVPWDGWKCVKPIGKGGFGTVYEIARVEHGIAEKAAMKKISIPQNSDEVDNLKIEGYDDQSITQRFTSFAEDIIREYGMMVRMKGNANIVYCDDYKLIRQDNGFGWDIYIKMELLTPLVKALGQVATEAQIIRFGMDMCNALEVCRKRNVIHRDIKPQNIFVSDDGVFKLGDFGIARTAEKTTRATMGIGTYQFMAPEVKNSPEYGATVDIYSLGLVMYWLLNARRMPFLPLPPAVPKHSEEEQARQCRFAGQKLPNPRDGSAALKQIVLKACAFDPKDRYQSAGEMREALARLSGGRIIVPDPDPELDDDTDPDYDDNETVGSDFATVSADDSNKSDNWEETVASGFSARKKQNKAKKKTWIPVAVAACTMLAVLGFVFRGGVEDNVPAADSIIAAPSFMDFTSVSPSAANSTVVLPSAADDYSPIGSKVIAVDSANFHTVLLRENGTVQSFGFNKTGQCDVSEWADIVAVSASDEHTLGLKADGTVIATGSNYGGQCDTSNWRNVVEIGGGCGYSAALRSDGTVYITGYTDGLEAVASWREITDIAVGGTHIVGRKADGSLVAAGRNYKGECDISEWTDIIAIDAAFEVTVGLRSDGTIVTAGPDIKDLNGISVGEDAVSVAVSPNHVAVLKKDGTLSAFGKNPCNQCDVSEWKNIVAVSVDFNHTIGVRQDGTVIAAGSSIDGELDFDLINGVLTPGTEEDDRQISVAIVAGSPGADILQIAGEYLKEYGYSLKIEETNDYIASNVAVENGESDANLFQHQIYLENYNKELGTDLVASEAVWYEPMVMLSGLEYSPYNLRDDAIIVIPNTQPSKARALNLLSYHSIITLKDGAGLGASVEDITENPYNLNIVEANEDIILNMRNFASLVVVSASRASNAGVNLAEEIILYEDEFCCLNSGADAYAINLVTQRRNETSKKIRALLIALRSPEVTKYIFETYNYGILPAID